MPTPSLSSIRVNQGDLGLADVQRGRLAGLLGKHAGACCWEAASKCTIRGGREGRGAWDKARLVGSGVPRYLGLVHSYAPAPHPVRQPSPVVVTGSIPLEEEETGRRSSGGFRCISHRRVSWLPLFFGGAIDGAMTGGRRG